MTNSLEAVTLYVPLMKEANMTWEDIKRTPRFELEGILAACHEYELLHSMDGYSNKDIGDMAKHRPEIRSDWNRYIVQKRKYEAMRGIEKKPEDVAQELKAELSK